MKTTILFHIYYPETIRDTSTLLNSMLNDETRLIFNVPVQSSQLHASISTEIQTTFPRAIVINTSNKGKDIGGKLAMLNTYFHLKEKSEYLVFLHDKKSELAYTINYKKIDSDIWKKELFSIIHPDSIPKIRRLFSDPSTGLVTHSSHIYTLSEHGEHVVFGNNTLNLEDLCNRLQLRNMSDKKTDFAGGTMFWVRSQIFEQFFLQHSPLSIRALLEEGNFTDRYSGTNSHAMERIFSWIVTSAGYQIKGV